MKLKRLSIGSLGLLAVSGFAWSCSSKSEDCNANLNCAPYAGEVGYSGASGAASASGASGTSNVTGGMSGNGGNSSGGYGNGGDGGADAAAGSGGAAPPPCDGTLSPEQDSCVISDEYGVFVGPTGMDATADGTQAHPYASVTAALAHIDKIKHVYVCTGDYSEPDTLQIPDRVSIYGGFTCDAGTWKYDSPVPAHLLSSSPIGALITDAKVGVVIQDLRLDAANALEDGTGANSFGLMVSGSQGVMLKRVEIRAGKGGKGGNGVDGATGVDGIASGDAQNGVAGTCTNPPSLTDGPHAVPKRQCGSEGGNGGAARVATDYAASQDGGSGYLVTPSNGGKGGDVFGQSGGRGGDGDGTLSVQGEAGQAASPLGTFSATGYKVASGGSGVAGRAGQGGGGGGASLGSAACIGATGGAGGMGGCGGDPGTGGTGGGASVALLSWQSTVSLDSCKLTANTAGAGGDGGKGHAGGAGKTGGLGGPKVGNVGKGGNGGDGADGADGGNGAGGSGGPSIALVYDGPPVTQITPAILSFSASPAAAGRGGAFGKIAPDGSKGLTQDIYPKPQ